MSDEDEQQPTEATEAKPNERQKWHLLTGYKDEQNPEHWGMRCGLFHGHTDIYWAEDRKQFYVGVCPQYGDYWRPVYFNTVFECMNYVETLSNEWDEYGEHRLDEPHVDEGEGQ